MAAKDNIFCHKPLNNDKKQQLQHKETQHHRQNMSTIINMTTYNNKQLHRQAQQFENHNCNYLKFGMLGAIEVQSVVVHLTIHVLDHNRGIYSNVFTFT